VVVRGRGTALHWGLPPRGVDLVVSTARMEQVVEHVAGDLVCVVDAGTRIDTVNDAVRQHGQQLALDQPLPGSSVAGAMATTRSGPRRLLYGTPRDQVLGITMVRPDGVVAKAGGKVVKNVAGYDIAKLMGGAYGTLGLVTRLVVRLHPLPHDSRWLRRTLPLADAASAALVLAGSQLAPSAVEVRRGAGADDATVLLLREGTERGVAARADEATAMLGQATEVADVETADLARIDAGDDDVVVKVAVPLTGVTAALVTARDVERRHQVACRVQGSAGAGVLTAVVTGAADGAAAAVEDLRAAATGGSAVVLQAPPAVRERVDSWGPVGGLDLMRRVKDEFDPEHRFAPGRFVGGI
jgi:glycolate oxidase FAD binding subunit